MTVPAIYNPSTNISGPELMPVKSGILTVNSGTGIAMAFKTINAFVPARIGIPIINASPNARIHCEILTQMVPSGFLLTQFIPSADVLVTSMVDETSSAATIFGSIDENTGATSNYITNNADFNTECKYTAKRTAGASSTSARVRRVGAKVWAGNDTSGGGGKIYKAKVHLGANAGSVEIGDLNISDIATPAETTIYSYINPPNNPWLPGQSYFAGASRFQIGVNAIAQSAQVLRIFDMTVNVETFSGNQIFWNTTWDAPGTNSLDQTLMLWKDMLVSTSSSSGGTGGTTLAAATTYYLHIAAVSGTIQIPYVIYGSYPTADARIVYKTSLDGPNGIINSTQTLGHGHIPFILKSTAFTVGSASATSNIGTVTTTAAHNLSAGQTVTISGTTNYNSEAASVLTAPTTTRFTYYLGSSPSAEAAGSVFGFEPNNYTVSRLLDNSSFKDNLNNSAATYVLPVGTAYSGTTFDQLLYTTTGNTCAGVKFPVKWQSSTRPDAPLEIELRTATDGGGTLRARAVLNPTADLNSQEFKIVSLPLLASYTTSAEQVFVYFKSTATSGAGWIVCVEDSFFGTNYVPSTSNFTKSSIQGNLFTQNNLESAGVRALLNTYSATTYSTNTGYQIPVQILYSPVPPKGLTVSAVAATSYTRI